MFFEFNLQFFLRGLAKSPRIGYNTFVIVQYGGIV